MPTKMNARTQIVNFRLSHKEIAQIDRQVEEVNRDRRYGAIKRSDYLRECIIAGNEQAKEIMKSESWQWWKEIELP